MRDGVGGARGAAWAWTGLKAVCDWGRSLRAGQVDVGVRVDVDVGVDVADLGDGQMSVKSQHRSWIKPV
jgi:hypothetical protein